MGHLYIFCKGYSEYYETLQQQQQQQQQQKHEEEVVVVVVSGREKKSCNSGIICSNIVCIQPNLVTLEAVSFIYMLTLVVLSLPEAPLLVLVWYSCKTCWHILFTFLYECKVMTFQPTVASCKEPDVERKIWKNVVDGNGWN
jgi:hypothetical protein